MLLTNTRYIQILTVGFNSFYLKYTANVKKLPVQLYQHKKMCYYMPWSQLEMHILNP